MKRLRLFFSALAIFAFIVGQIANAQVPELMYYRFHNNTATGTPNFASAPVGTNPALLVASDVFTSGGQFDSCLSGTGSLTGCLNTGWATAMPSNWTISFWLGPNQVDANPSYLWGDINAGTFRCFYGGAAGVNNVLLRGGSADVLITGVNPTATVITIVYNGTNTTVYKNGVFFQTFAVTFAPSGSGPFKVGGYGTGASASISGKMDEFRMYNRALGQAEITATWNTELTGGTSVNAPHQWCSNYPAMTGTGAIFGHAVCSYGDTIYVAGGDPAGAGTTNFYKYSISGNVWSTGASLPTAKTGGDLVACAGKIYYIGGGTAITAGDATEYVYNPATGQWTTIANIPTPVTGNVAVQVGDANIYCLMGGWTSYLTTIQVYNVGANTWSTATAISGGPGRRSFAAGIMGRTILVSMGYNGTYLNSTVKGVIDASNPLTITWSAVTNVQWTASRAGGTAIGGKFYVCPGDTGTGIASGGIGIFDTTTGTWTYAYGDPFVASNYWGAMTANITNCNGVQGIKVWRVGGLLSTQTTRPLIAYADTCLTGCGLVGITSHHTDVPNSYRLSQNYPNPFNPSTEIEFAIPKAGLVKIVVYDILGREVKTLVNETKQAGEYKIYFNASSLASGVYFYRINANDFTQTKKMLLIK